MTSHWQCQIIYHLMILDYFPQCFSCISLVFPAKLLTHTVYFSCLKPQGIEYPLCARIYATCFTNTLFGDYLSLPLDNDKGKKILSIENSLKSKVAFLKISGVTLEFNSHSNHCCIWTDDIIQLVLCLGVCITLIFST